MPIKEMATKKNKSEASSEADESPLTRVLTHRVPQLQTSKVFLPKRESQKETGTLPQRRRQRKTNAGQRSHEVMLGCLLNGL